MCSVSDTIDPLADDLALALTLADAADAATMRRFGALDLRVETKPDLTPVTDADKGAEQLLRSLLAEHRPGDGIVGEEYAALASLSSRRWVLDPIDGTKNFVRGVPVWATLIALLDDSLVPAEPDRGALGASAVVGVVSAPALGRRWWAMRGGGAWTRTHLGGVAGAPRRLSVTGVSELGDASLAYSDDREWDRAGLGRGFANLKNNCWRVRGYGDFWPYMLLAEGAVDLCGEPELQLYDMAALVPVITEAGGVVSGPRGGDWATEAGLLAGNPRLHAAALQLISGGDENSAS